MRHRIYMMRVDSLHNVQVSRPRTLTYENNNADFRGSAGGAVMTRDIMMEKLGPCQACGDFKKPCRCCLEQKIKDLKNSLNNCLAILEDYSGTNGEMAMIELAVKRLEDMA